MQSTASPPRPVESDERIASLDVLRGFALLGILVMNIQSYAMVGAAYFNPTAFGDLTGANFAVWVASHLLADMKFMTIFSMLFGAGIVLMTRRAEARGGRPARLHYRRMGVLLLFGLAHAHLLWYGDILFWYGMCGLVVYLFRRLSPRWLLVLGLLTVAVASALSLFFGWSMRFWPPGQIEAFANDWQPTAEMVAQEVTTYQGGWLTQMEHRMPQALYFETFVLAVWAGWRAGGLMLVGMGLFKLGAFSAKLAARSYAAMVALALLVGLPLVAYGAHRQFEAAWDVSYSFFYGAQYNYWGSILVALGWVGLVMLACQSPSLVRRLGPLAAVGRMALTNYLLQSILCTALFYGHGLGLFGRVERVWQIAIVAGVWVLQLLASPLWLRHFRFGPFEWLWRTLTYMKPQPFRRVPERA